MSASWQRILGLTIVSAWLAAGCTSPMKIDAGGTCILNSDCNQGLVCTWGKCHVACNTSADCPAGGSCVTSSDQSNVCQLPGETYCIYNHDCPAGLICGVDQKCRKQCQVDVDCLYGQICTSEQTCVDLNNSPLVLDGGVASAGGTGGVNGTSGVSGSGGGGATGDAGVPDVPSAQPDVPIGGSGGEGGTTSSGGTVQADAAVDAPVDTGPPPISYALDPPNQLINQFFIPGCQTGVVTSPGGGNCTPGQNACEGTKPGARVNFLCPRFMLFSDEMAQAALDDGNTGLNYAVVGHDADTGGIDGNVTMSCCQCYQLVYSLPENAAQVGGNGASAIPIPPPLVVQSFNTSAGGGKNFDVFMGAGGFGAFNACDPNASMASPSGKYLYTQFPPDGEPGSGGENAVTQIAGCRGSNNLTTTATLSSTTCQTNVATACGKFKSNSTTVTNESIQSCVQSNAPNTYYHINWKIYAKRVECPTHLTQVTGCRLASQGLPAVNPAVTTPDQAAADSSFKSGYTTTTMQDCCMPTCAWQNNTKGQNLAMVGDYDSFYSCDQNGVPLTETSTADAGK